MKIAIASRASGQPRPRRNACTQQWIGLGGEADSLEMAAEFEKISPSSAETKANL